MNYMGSKNRIAKYLLPIMLANRKEGQWWVEPFVGGANMIDKVSGNRIGCDINTNVIFALEEIRDNLKGIPKNKKDFTEKDYVNLRTQSKLYMSHGIAFCGFAYSYGGKWFGGWRRDKEKKRDYVAEAYRNAVKQSPKLKGVVLVNESYQNLIIPSNSIIYCDPPYEGTTSYKNGFDHKIFCQWCRDKKAEGHTVFVSEYNAPPDFKCVWEKEIVSSLTKNTGAKKGTEKLFTLGGAK